MKKVYMAIFIALLAVRPALKIMMILHPNRRVPKLSN